MKIYRPIFFIMIFLLGSCQSHDQSEHHAFDKVKQDKESTDPTPEVVAKPIPQSSEKIIYIDSFQLFLSEMNRIILQNEAKIKSIKSTPNISIKLLKKVTVLEKSNNEIRSELDAYEIRKREEWNNFKQELRKKCSAINSDFSEMEAKK